MSEPLLAGAAQVDITPQPGVDMGGYGGRPGPAEGVHDPLIGAALCIQGQETVVLITADLVGVDRATADRVRAAVAERTGASAEAVMLTCSHTHAGPAMPCLPTLGQPGPGVVDAIARKLIDAAVQAWEQREPARLGSTREPVAIGMNRREVTGDQRRPELTDRGTIAPYVDVLRVDSAGGEPIAVWFSHAAHPVTLRGHNCLYSADWVGDTRRHAAERLGDAVLLFAQGCAGNVVSWPQADFDITDRQGAIMAEALARAFERIELQPNVRVSAAQQHVALPLADPPTVDEALALIDQCRAERASQWDQANRGMRQLLDGWVEWADRVLALARAGATGRSTDFLVQAVRVGELGLVALEGEVFVEYALAIDAASPLPRTAVLGYSNGNVGYVPTAVAFGQGGYEVDTAVRYYGDTPFTPAIEPLILGAADRVLRELA